MYSVRLMESSDITDVASLFDSYRVFYHKSSDLQQAVIYLKNLYDNRESVVYVAISPENKIVGFEQLYPLFSSLRMNKMWLLNDLFVEKSFRGCGISKLLIRQAQSHCLETSACGLSLETDKSNVIANNLYMVTGFLPDSDHNFYFWAVQ
jgi:GNAT superfamily N-acetyltransferase